MATKTFKIGLSDTDKQNMAQDIYERLIGMSFDEYDSSKTYNKGDFVVYENPENTFKLYECNSDNVTGVWDSSKWDLATFQTLIDNIEDAVAFVNDKANVDGNYPTMTVGVADQLSPYDDESGDDQDEPFSFQATGTGNGSQPDFSTGAIALLKEKQGNTVVVNQLAKELNATNYPISGVYEGKTSFSNGVITFAEVPANSSYARLFNKQSFVSGHKVLVHFYATVSEGNIRVGLFADGGYSGGNSVVVSTASNPNQYFIVQVNTEDEVAIMTATGSQTSGLVKDLIAVDLTQWFNGDIPEDLLDNPSNFFRYYQGDLSYNEGELVNANGRYIKCIGRNQWDEEVSENYYYAPDGTKTATPNYDACANKIKVIPNATYHYQSNNDGSYGGVIYIRFFDKDGNCLTTTEQGIYIAPNGTFTVPSNAVEMAFYSGFLTHFGSNPKITISLYYEGESGYDQYYPYEVLTNNDTGNEVLRSAGNVHDIKLPSGEIKRNIGYVDLGTLDYTINDGFFMTTINDMKPQMGLHVVDRNIVSSMYSYDYNLTADKTMGLSSAPNSNIWFRNDAYGTDTAAFKTAMSGVYLFYELAEPTTEQGTPYSENVVIDDFGSMDFSGTNGVPQGNLIFYPVDYKAFIDTLYDYTDGTPSNIALKSDLTGLVAQEDLSSGITDSVGLTYAYKKAYKTGDVITITIVATNNTGSQIAATTTLLQLSSNLRPGNSINFPYSKDLSNDVAVIYSSGELAIASALDDGASINIVVSYIK